LVRVGYRALAEPQKRPDLAAVILERAARPLIKPQISRCDPDLAGQIGHHLAGKLAAAARESAMQREVLQLAGEAQPRRAALARDLFQLLGDQRPLLDQLVVIDRPRHARNLLPQPRP